VAVELFTNFYLTLHFISGYGVRAKANPALSIVIFSNMRLRGMPRGVIAVFFWYRFFLRGCQAVAFIRFYQLKR
jgi:hypothetical protein